MHHYTK